jgi:hypothetical protein
MLRAGGCAMRTLHLDITGRILGGLGRTLLVFAIVPLPGNVLNRSLQNHLQHGPHLILWIRNFVFQVAGAALLWRANRGI